MLTYLKERIREVLTGTSDAITIRISGQDLDLLREKATEVDELLGDIPGVIENHVEFQDNIPQIKVEVDLAAAQQYGVKPGDVRRAAAWMMAGEEAGDIYRGRPGLRRAGVEPARGPAERERPAEPADRHPGGGVRCGSTSVADISIVPVPNVIHHNDLFRNIDVGANLDGSRDLGSVVADVEDGTRRGRLAAGVPRGDAR